MKRVGGRKVWSIADVTEALSRRFDDIPSIWVEAEVQNLRAGAGQVYFTLAGDHQIAASMNRIVFDRLRHRPADGMLVQAYGRIGFWRERARVSLRVERMEPAGEGLLRAQVEELRGRLEGEGLLAQARKRALPRLPRRIGLVTSPDGAARDDVLRNLFARSPAADVLVVGVPVQGDGAPAAIVRALRHLDAVPEVDVVIVARGGGSLEDLMAFNSEPVCRAVAAARAPVVSAVGHERDLTLCDLVADLRVSTPTAAAQAVVPDVRDLVAELDARELALGRRLVDLRERARERLDVRSARLRMALRGAGARGEDRLEDRSARLSRALQGRGREARGRAERSAALLDLLSPERTVARGYAIVRHGGTGRVLASAADAAPDDPLVLQLRDGRVPARVTAAPEGDR